MVSTAERAAARDESGASVSDALHVRSRRFGSFEVPCASVLHVPQGLIGFPTLRRYVVLDHRPGSPFKWLLAMDDPELAFAVANPGELVPDYQPPLELAARLLDTDPAEIALFVIVTIPPDPTRMTVNLMAPVVVDMRTRRARQIVLDDPRCPPDHLVIPPQLVARA
ncbi:MAG: flagellar assembly protein FliW [Deltaproteobacteria bacterium]|nr:flagellar assembly protein FliW [Deltaproteobacteria bacterium]